VIGNKKKRIVIAVGLFIVLGMGAYFGHFSLIATAFELV